MPSSVGGKCPWINKLDGEHGQKNLITVRCGGFNLGQVRAGLIYVVSQTLTCPVLATDSTLSGSALSFSGPPPPWEPPNVVPAFPDLGSVRTPCPNPREA